MTLFRFLAAHRAEFLALLLQHIVLVGVSTGAAIAIGIPVGVLAARRPRLGAPIVWFANVVQTIPSLAMFGFLLPLPFVGGLGARVAIVVLILYALLPIIRTTVAGVRGVDRVLVEAGTALGMTPRQLLWQVELPLAMPSMVAGIRVAAVIGVGTATIAAAVGAGGLGEYIFRGLSMVDPTVILAGAVPAAILALTVDGTLLLAERALRIGARSRKPLAVAAIVALLAVVAIAAVPALGSGRRDAVIRVEFHRANQSRRARRPAARRGDWPQGRTEAESRRHVHLRSRAALRRHRRLRGIHGHGRYGGLQESCRDRSRARAGARPPAIRRRRADAHAPARLREYLRDSRSG
jgi:osmoprotectant transport system permease protein